MGAMAEEPPVAPGSRATGREPPPQPPRASQSIAGVLLVALGVVLGLVGLLVVTVFASRPNGGSSVLLGIVLGGGSSALCILGGLRVIRGLR